jgi:hypothetical protein
MPENTSERSSMMTCTTCGRPADDGYLNTAAGEVCVDEVHDAHLTADCRQSAARTREIIREMGVLKTVVFEAHR